MRSIGNSSTIAVDINPATREVVTGTERFTREVCRRLPDAAPELRWRFFASRPRAGLGVDIVVVPFPRLWSQVRLPFALAAEGVDLLFVPAHAVPFAWTGPAVAVVHDLAFEKHPGAYSLAERTYLQVTTRWAATRCRLIVTVSESTRQDLIDTYRTPSERIRVVPLGVDPPPHGPAAHASRLAQLGLDGSFVLQVGRVEARKNQAMSLAAVEKLDGMTTLVVAGPERDRGLSERLRNSTHCRVLGMVDPPLLELLYRRASAVIVPSLYEGFGLPVLEAMARGKVVVAAKSSSLPEVGGDAALYFSGSAGADEVAQVLKVALTDEALRSRLARAAKARAAGYTWDRTAAGVAAVIREALDRQSPGRSRPTSAAPPDPS